MLKRIITAAVGLALFLPTLFLSGRIPLLFISVIAILAFIAEYEICGCFGVRKALFISIPTYLFSLFAMGYIAFFTYFVPHTPHAAIIAVAIFAYLFVVFAGTMFSDGRARFAQAASTVGATIYVLVGFASIILTRYMASPGTFGFSVNGFGLHHVLLIFIGVWLTDSGAYFVGSALGKHKLIPAVSPHKTVEGAFGGIIGAIIGYAAYGLILQFAFGVKVNYIYLIVLAVVVSIIDQVGDLIASFMKREQGIKDFGKIFPGHGGVMDRFDSSIAVAPAIFFITYFVTVPLFT
ncbi:MAG: phosphatidate cytidylyltransferase [Clostridia bacterium]|nr:phosphatidate cytidylyltransferase [Clostridia bacterium]